MRSTLYIKDVAYVRDGFPPVVLFVREVTPPNLQLAKLGGDRVDLLAPVLFAPNRDVRYSLGLDEDPTAILVARNENGSAA